MQTALLTIFAIGVIAFFVFRFIKGHQDSDTEDSDKENNNPSDCNKAPATSNSECNPGDQCGVSCFCDDTALQRQMSEDIIYFEDEELDAYKGLSATDYSPEQIEEFSEVLTTLLPNEVPEWLHSLQLRGIELPKELQDEVAIMMEN